MGDATSASETTTEPLATSSSISRDASACVAGSSSNAAGDSSSSAEALSSVGNKASKTDLVIEYSLPDTPPDGRQAPPPLVMKDNDPRVEFCEFFKKFKSNFGSGGGAADGDQSSAQLPNTITPQLMEHIRKWCAYHATLPEESTDSEDEQLTEPERLVKEYLPSTKIPAFDEIFFQRLDQRTRIELMNAADFLGCDQLLDNLAKFVAKKLTRKTPAAIRRMFGIVDPGISDEDLRVWKEKYGWALIGCTDEVDAIDCVTLTPEQEVIVRKREAEEKASGFWTYGTPSTPAAAAAPAAQAGPSGSGGGDSDADDN